MALTDPLQWVLIAVVAIVFLMYGPKKIPELAKSIGLARKEFSAASAAGASAPAATSVAVASAAARPAFVSTGDPVLDVARKLGVQTEGKTRDEIANLIVVKANSA